MDNKSILGSSGAERQLLLIQHQFSIFSFVEKKIIPSVGVHWSVLNTKEDLPFSNGREIISRLEKINVDVEIRAWANLFAVG